jgi:hypothetical protein
VTVEASFYMPGETFEAASAEFMSESLAKRFARTALRGGQKITAERVDGTMQVKHSQMAAWILGTPRDLWPD